MTEVKGLCFRNLPFNISELELRKELCRIFPNVFQMANQRNTLTVQIYSSVGKAVISGFNGIFEEMVVIAQKNKIKGRDIVMNIDQGEERDEFGNFKINVNPEVRRKVDQLRGVSHRKVTSMFSDSFWNKINVKLFDQNSLSGHVYLKAITLGKDVLEVPGRLQQYTPKIHLSSTRLYYRSILETLQAISYFNENSTFGQPAPYFTDRATEKQRSLCVGGNGIGVDGTILKISDVAIENHSIIPLEHFDQNILNKNMLKRYESHCWRCEKTFLIKGCDMDLNFLAGICQCKYTIELDILDQNRAYCWDNEPFTRLSPAQSAKKQLFILHRPMKPKFADAIEYQNIVLPILQEEWKYNSYEYKQKYTCEGKIVYQEYVETLTNKLGNEDHVYAVQLTVPQTKFWTPENFPGIGELTLSMKVNKKFQHKEGSANVVRKGRARSLLNGINGTVIIFVQLKIDSNSTPRIGETVLVIPKPLRYEYSTTKHLIRTWANTESKVNSLMSIFLNPEISQKWNKDSEILKNLVYTSTKYKLRIMCDDLNSEQKTAVTNAEKHPVTIIHGPPGCGKTYTASAIAVKLATLEKGPVLICTPTNVAGDGIAETIQSLSKNNFLSVKVLRIYSKKRELQMMNKTITNFSNDDQDVERHSINYKILHEEIQTFSDDMDDEMNAIVQKINAGRDYCLTKAEREMFEEHVKKIEGQVMNEYQVFVSTIGALADTRIQNWSKLRPIQTVIVDEIGQVTHPSTIITFLVNPKRIVFTGDHKQLKAVIKSYAAESVGLSNSIMDWVLQSSAKSDGIRWTSLVEQHRMDAVIREIVSTVSYNNTLKDAPVISSRELDITEGIYNALPELRVSSVVVYDHKFPELHPQVGTSHSNENEALLILGLVQKMLNVGVSASKITILTLYEAQRKVIASKIKDIGEKIAVLNVDGFQGRENSVIILSFVRSNPEASIGFTSQPNRLNVAISRAKFFLLIACNFDNFKGYRNQAWKSFTNELSKKAVFVR